MYPYTITNVNARETFDLWMEGQSRKDLESARILLESKNNDFGNILFLLEQSYEKILKVSYTFCQTVIFKQDFHKVSREILSHEKGVLLIQKILPTLLKGYRNSLTILEERASEKIISGKMDFDNVLTLGGLMLWMPSYSSIIKWKGQIIETGKKSTSWAIKKKSEPDSYESWLDFLKIIRSADFKQESFSSKFQEGYSKYDKPFEKMLPNADRTKIKIRNATMFLSYAVGLAPLTLAYRFARYPEAIAKYQNLKQLAKNPNLTSRGLHILYEIVNEMISWYNDFINLISRYQQLHYINRRWKRREERLIKRTRGHV